jgi:hypothetical protein
MGSSLVKFRGKAFWVSDGLLEVWLYLLAREIDILPDKPARFSELKEKWHHEATKGGVGWVSPNLDEWLTNEQCIQDLLTLCEVGLRRLDQYEDVIPKIEADKMGPEGSFFWNDPPTEPFKKLGLHFMKLLRGEVDTVGLTSRTNDFLQE